MKQVVISVSAGVAEIEYVSEGVEVNVIDFDNIEETGEDTEQILKQAIEKAKKEEKE